MGRLWNLIRASNDLRRAQSMARPEMLRLQEQRWRKLAKFAREKSPFYQHHLAGLDLDRCAFEEIPVLTKDVLKQHWDEIVTDPRLRHDSLQQYVARRENWGRLMDGRWMVSMTSGTTGAALIIPQDIHAVDWNHAAHAVRVGPTAKASTGPKPSVFKKRPKVVAFTTLSAPSVSSALFLTRPWISKLLWDYHTVNATAPWEEIIRQVENIQPQILIGYASLIGRLAQAKLDGRLRLDLPSDTGVISSGGDTLTPGIRALCRRAFGIEPLDGYGCGETLGIARQWKGMPNLVIFEDIAVLEAVDAYEHACPEGELSDHALVTPLFNTALPLLRYRVEDRIRLGPVQEGWPFRTLTELMGRGSMSYLFKIPGPSVFIGSKFISIMEHLPLVTTYQFQQTGWDALECRFVVQAVEREAVISAAIQDEVRRCLDGAGCAGVKFRAISVPSISPDPRTGKVEQNRPFPAV